MTLEDKKSHKANIFEVLQELESDAFVFDPGLQVLVFATLYREEPVEVVGQLRAAAGTGDQEASQVGELRSGGMAGYREGGTEGSMRGVGRCGRIERCGRVEQGKYGN